MANVTDFLALMAKHNVPSNACAGLDYKKLYGGLTMVGTLRLNLPLTIVLSEEFAADYGSDTEEFDNVQLLIAQRYADNDSLFVPYHYPYPMVDSEIMGCNFDDLTVIDQLLSGETVRFYEDAYRGTEAAATATRWLDVSLNRGA